MRRNTVAPKNLSPFIPTFAAYFKLSMQSIRNIAIIAHVDHGKTTLVDKMIYATNTLRQTEDNADLILDNNEL